MSNGPKDTGGNGPGGLKVEGLGPEVRDLVSPESGEPKDVIDWGLKIFSIPEKWKKTQGEGVTVAILDTGIAYNHPDLSIDIKKCKDFTDSPFRAADLDGHGTHVAGIIAARKDSKGVVGVAPKANLLIGKVIGDQGRGSQEQLAKGILWAVEEGADIISISLENIEIEEQKGKSAEIAKKKKLEAKKIEEVHDAIKAAVEKGIFVICAAGNNIHVEKDEEMYSKKENQTVYLDRVKFPAKHPETIAVGAINRNLKIPRYSPRNELVDIVAPGDKILSTYPPKHFATLSGTSMAAPFVSGVTALMLAENPYKYKNEIEPVKRKKMLIDDLLNELAVDPKEICQEAKSAFGFMIPGQLLDYEDITTADSFLERFVKLIVKSLKGFFQGKGLNLKIALGAISIVLIVYVLIQYVL